MYQNKTRLLHLDKKRSVRVVLSLLFIIASITFLWTALDSAHSSARAGAPSVRETSTPTNNPWGIAFDNSGNVWVAEPGCDGLNCSAQSGAIAHYSHQNFTLIQDYQEPGGYTSPLFLAVDAQGNLWFTEPISNAIGELTLSNGNASWNQWTVPTANATPYDLAFDAAGNLWFTEFNASNIGEFVPSSQQFFETATPTPNSNPYGIVGPDPSTGAMWFTENNSSVSRIASFKPPTTGSLNSSDINEYLTKNSSNSTPHLITFDKRGKIWWTEGFNGSIGSLAITQAAPGTSNGVSEYAVPLPQGCQNCTHISGIAVDSKGTVWFNDSLSSRIGSYVPGSGTFSMITIGGGTNSNAHPHDGLAVDSSDNAWFTEEFANKLGEAMPNSAPNLTPTAPTPPPGAPPVNKSWYFGEGRVGGGFQEYITLDNPDLAQTCMVDVRYMYTPATGQPASKTQALSLAPTTRATRSVNTDLGFPSNQSPAASVSTFVAIDTSATPACAGVVAERPMYFHFGESIQSGSDVLGATQTGKTFYFADVPTGGGYSSFLTILNPGTNTANVTASYYANAQMVKSQAQQVLAGSRGTINPNSLNLPQHVAAVITSDQPIVVERPDYFSAINGGAAGSVSGGTCVMGVQTLSNDWLFAEGTTRTNFQEYFVLANLDASANSSANISIKLEYKDGSNQTFAQMINPNSQLIWNVSQHARPGDVSAEVTSSGAKIIVEREMFFRYGATRPAVGGTDVIGQPGPANQFAYSFAEGYSGSGFNEWLTLQNPTSNAENLYLTLINANGQTYSQWFQVGPTTRLTVNVTALVLQHLASNLSVSMLVQSQNNAPFVAERPMYWNVGGSLPTNGGTDIIGYTGM